MPTHVVYIDDSGTKEYADSKDKYGRSGNSRYFVFGGVLISTQESGNLTSKIVAKKLEYFGTESVEVKSNWLRREREREKRYLKPYELSESNLNEFIDHFYQAVLETDLMLVAAVVDKVHMQEKYPDPWYPPAVAYDALLQRVENELHHTGTASINIDDMTGATPKGNQYKANLSKQHEKLKQYGSSLRSGFKYTCIDGRLKFVNSAHSHLIQVADVAAYNVYRQFTDHGDKWETKGLKTLPSYDHFKRITPKFRQDTSGRIQGYGVVKVPVKTKVIWGVRKSKEKAVP